MKQRLNFLKQSLIFKISAGTKIRTQTNGFGDRHTTIILCPREKNRKFLITSYQKFTVIY